jgi:hypothetical protein
MRSANAGTTGWIAALTGLLSATAVAFSTRPDLPARLSVGKAALAAMLWMALTALAGTLGMVAAEIMARGRPGWPAPRHLLSATAAWLLIPPMLLCWIRGSGGAVMLSACAAAAMAVCVRGMTPAQSTSEEEWETEAAGLFAGLPPPDSGWPQAFVIAVCAELAVVLVNRRSIFLAAVLMGIAAFLYVWERFAAMRTEPGDGMARPAGRAAMATVLALLILIPLLLARTDGGGVETTAQAASRAQAADADASDAFRGIILFTVKEKEKELPPVPLERDPLRTGAKKPLVIPFDGAYWYFQAPQRDPGLHPHLAHGDPVAVNIYSTGWVPLAMQAHQTLERPVELASCGALQVTVRNGDNRPGSVDLGVLLTDSTQPGKPTIYLGMKPIQSTEEGHFTLKVNPVDEDVEFAIPAHAGMRKFDEITVYFFPAEQRSTLGARMGIEQFELMPR